MRHLIFALFLCLMAACKPTTKQPPLLPEHQKALASFQVMDGFKVELVAAEPLVQDPVAMEIDERGRMYVVEMPGYPLDLAKSGKIKIFLVHDKKGFSAKFS